MKRKNSNKITDKVTIYKRGKSDIWYAGYTENGNTVAKSLRTSNMGVALDSAKAIDLELTSTNLPQNLDAPETIEDAIQEFLGHLESEGNTKSTLKRYRPIFGTWLGFCKSKKVYRPDQLNQRVLERYRIFRKDEVTDYTRYFETQRVVEFGRYLARHKIVKECPFSLEGIKKPIKGKLPWFNSAQVESILETVSETDSRLFEFLAFTGLRISELKRLTWENVDLEKGTIYIESTITNPTKTKRPRILPLHYRAKEVLLAIEGKTDLIFNSGESKKYPLGDGPVNERRLLERVKKACRKLEIDGCIHSFRKFFCSYCANNGVPILTLKAWIGHSKSTATLEEHYYLLDEMDSINQMEQISRSSKKEGVSEK